MLLNVRVTRIVPLLAVLAAHGGCKKAAEAPASPAADPPAADPEEEPPRTVLPPLHVRLVAVDRTTKNERPVDMAPGIQALAETALKRAGYTLADKGHEAGAEVFYALVNDGKPDPKTERGTIAWGVSVTIRVEDADGLAEAFEGRRGDERPFIRGAVPDLKAAFDDVIGTALEGAARDAAMQIEYQKADAAKCVAALVADHPEEKWAALRRLGELGAKDSAGAVIDILDGADELTLAVAIAALGRLRNPVAVKPLARLAEGPSVERASMVVSALAGIGGPEARKYLELIGASHPSEQIREAVRTLLAPHEDQR